MACTAHTWQAWTSRTCADLNANPPAELIEIISQRLSKSAANAARHQRVRGRSTTRGEPGTMECRGYGPCEVPGVSSRQRVQDMQYNATACALATPQLVLRRLCSRMDIDERLYLEARAAFDKKGGASPIQTLPRASIQTLPRAKIQTLLRASIQTLPRDTHARARARAHTHTHPSAHRTQTIPLHHQLVLIPPVAVATLGSELERRLSLLRRAGHELHERAAAQAKTPLSQLEQAGRVSLQRAYVAT